MTDLELMLKFLMQVLVILGACKIVGYLGVRFLGQAQVTMEMVVGIMLGPSLFGIISPGIQADLFPIKSAEGAKHPSMVVLFVIAQIGLILYMFLIGTKFDLGHIKGKSKAAISISGAGILFPFIFGVLIYFLFADSRTGFFGDNVSDIGRALFLGAAMCITAFPMLARIIYEAGMADNRMGTLVLGSGATDDVVSWIILAGVLAQSKGQPEIAIRAIGGGFLFVILMFTLGKKLLAAVLSNKTLDQGLFTLIILFVFAGAWFTDAIGVYAVFGAFIIGAAMPKGEISESLQKTIEPLTVGLFLPFFFVYSGLNTKLNSIVGFDSWMLAVIILIGAVVGKLGGCYLAARYSGESHHNSLGIGILMNSRGLMELIILNIGLQAGIITIQFYSIMVIMAIVTTLMTAPLFRLIKGKLTIETTALRST